MAELKNRLKELRVLEVRKKLLLIMLSGFVQENLT
jgi:hypothetical protein